MAVDGPKRENQQDESPFDPINDEVYNLYADVYGLMSSDYLIPNRLDAMIELAATINNGLDRIYLAALQVGEDLDIADVYQTYLKEDISLRTYEALGNNLTTTLLFLMSQKVFPPKCFPRPKDPETRSVRLLFLKTDSQAMDTYREELYSIIKTAHHSEMNWQIYKALMNKSLNDVLTSQGPLEGVDRTSTIVHVMAALKCVLNCLSQTEGQPG